MNKNDICNDLEVLANGLHESLVNKEYSIVASLVFVRKMEEYKEFLAEDTYSKLILFHDNTFREQGIKYANVYTRLLGEGYHLPPYK